MKIYWNIAQIPELAGLSKQEQRQLWQTAYWRSFLHWQTWIAWAYLIAVVLLSGLLAAAVIPPDAGYRALFYCLIIGGIPTGLVLAFVTTPIMVTVARPYMAERLKQPRSK